MSRFDFYRNIKVECDSDEDSNWETGNISHGQNHNDSQVQNPEAYSSQAPNQNFTQVPNQNFTEVPNHSLSQAIMDANQVQALIQNAVSQALAQQEERFQSQLNAVTIELNSLRVQAPQVESFKRIVVQPDVRCDIPLDIIKSVPEFEGRSDEYVAWRQSACDAYELFKPFNGSCAHYQAVTIIRNKIRGAARAVLVSHNTVLNFDAIKARLDCSYADKTSLRLLRQGLEMVRQGDLSIMNYYDEVEKKLTLVTNKIVMTHETKQATLLNEEVRSDALHAFISGMRKSIKAVVFPAQPRDLPSALALAREAEASIERSIFSATYARAMAERDQARE